MLAHQRVLEEMLRRLNAATSRTPLLKVHVTKTGRLLDVAGLADVEPKLPVKTIETLLSGKGSVRIDLEIHRPDVECNKDDSAAVGSDTEKLRRVERHRQMYDLLDRRMQRHAELVRRETGVHALWLGYPLLYVSADVLEEPDHWILAPMFLWPIFVQPDLRHEGRLQVGRAKDASGKESLPPVFNLPMSLWIERMIRLDLTEPSEAELEDLSQQSLVELVTRLAAQFQRPARIELEGSLEAIPQPKQLRPTESPRLYHSAVLGLFRWQNESIQRDIQTIRDQVDPPVRVAGAFTCGTVLPRPVQLPPPPESDRYFVHDADFSQQRVVWQARSEPGVVVHGPPGTGKSQTIVNIIADALAHGHTVLMACQKKVATHVVLERLRAAGLDGLCLEVHDPEADRLPVFKAVREQVQIAATSRQSPKNINDRDRMAQRIDALEAQMDQYVAALHGRHPQFGLSYRDLMSREGQLYRRFPMLREFPELKQALTGLTGAQLPELIGQVEEMGRLFRRADPIHNPWCRSRPDVAESSCLRDDVNAVAKRICDLDRQHREILDGRPPPLTLPADVRQFADLAPLLCTRLTNLANGMVSTSGLVRIAARFRFAVWSWWRRRSAPWLENCLRDAFEAEARQPRDFAVARRRIEDTLDRCEIVEEIFNAIRSLETYLTDGALERPRRFVCEGKSIVPWVRGLVRGIDALPALRAWQLDLKQRMSPIRGILEALESYERRLANGDPLPQPPNDLPTEQYGGWWAALASYSAWRLWLAQMQNVQPILLETTPQTHAAKVQELAQLVTQKRKLETDAISCRCQFEQVKYVDRDWTRMFQLRHSTRGEAKRLREAVALSLRNGLLAMRPCWLMNPGAVCQVFPLHPELFDVVIFDEASQCPLEQAIAVIYRGKRVIVTGDEQQLPPTSFFQSRWTGDDEQPDDEDSEATEAPVETETKLAKAGIEHLLKSDDLLAAAIGTLPEAYLRVHYRSEHPSLIEFSNRAFYDGRLETPPGRMIQAPEFRPIEYHVVSGRYLERTNRDEGRKVIELLRGFWEQQNSAPTVGVVTFNEQQRDLIENLLEDECQADEQFSARFNDAVARREHNQDVGFFVKNLENVQGDERDVIIFSTTFGRDADGRFHRRFGPLGQVGGERRLNVAVTRAKQKVLIVGSMPIVEVSTALASIGGPGAALTPKCYLQLYLAYAQAISVGNQLLVRQILDRLRQPSDARSPTGDYDSPFEDDVAEAIREMGFQVEPQVGEAGFRIDLAVVHPVDRKLGYVLGVECDGAAYHSDRSALLRDVWREQILKDRGWRLHRIWSTRWWYHRNEEREILRHAIESVVVGQATNG